MNTGDDIVFMKKGGKIDFMSNTQKYGDVETDDISRWLVSTIKNLASVRIVYEQINQKVFFFVLNKVLVLFKNMLSSDDSQTPMSPWSVYTTTDSSLFNTNAAKYMRAPGTTTYTTYWGDSAGRIFDMNGTGTTGDAGSSNVTSQRKTRLIGVHEGRDLRLGTRGLDLRKKMLTGSVTYRRIGQVQLTLEFDWQDEYNVSKSVITLKGPPSTDTGAYFGGADVFFGGSKYFNQGFAFANKESSQTFSPTGKGDGLFLTMTVDGAPEFQIDRIDLDDA
jgi:hypothetical protein